MQVRAQVDRRVILQDANISRGNDAEIKRDRGVYVGVDEESDSENGIVDDGLEDIWNEMSMGLEFSKVSLDRSIAINKIAFTFTYTFSMRLFFMERILALVFLNGT